MSIAAKTKEEVPVMTAEVLAKAIAQIAAATKAMYRAGLTEKTLIMLVAEASGVSRTNVKYVLGNMYNLDKAFLVQPKAK